MLRAPAPLRACVCTQWLTQSNTAARLALAAAVFIENEPRPGSGLAVSTVSKWMYGLGVSLFLSEDEEDTIGLVYLMRGTPPIEP
jgi:hypothetical protein